MMVLNINLPSEKVRVYVEVFLNPTTSEVKELFKKTKQTGGLRSLLDEEFYDAIQSGLRGTYTEIFLNPDSDEEDELFSGKRAFCRAIIIVASRLKDLQDGDWLVWSAEAVHKDVTEPLFNIVQIPSSLYDDEIINVYIDENKVVYLSDMYFMYLEEIEENYYDEPDLIREAEDRVKEIVEDVNYYMMGTSFKSPASVDDWKSWLE